MVKIFVPKITRASVKHDGTDVLVTLDGKRVLRLPWDAAKELARAIRIQAGRAEETAKHEAIAYDQAILMRSGAPFGLTSNPIILNEARKEALYNPKLGKRSNGNKKSVLGKPDVLLGEPK